jgi:SAM-dependent methyltransferase
VTTTGSREALSRLIASCAAPSEAFWRFAELDILSQVRFVAPILEIGCGTGEFTSQIVECVELAVDINQRAVSRARLLSVYKEVQCIDIREYDGGARYSTVLANCVLEHIDGLPEALRRCCMALRAGGVLVATVPLEAMNRHLALRAQWYVALRQRQLQHVNLLTVVEWDSLLRDAGFHAVTVMPYLSGEECHAWDVIDGVLSIGGRRYTLANVAHHTFHHVAPASLRVRVAQEMADKMCERWERSDTSAGVPCAALLVASK